MKKCCFWLLGFIFTSSVEASGIDWEKSIMMVEFEAESSFVPTFSCFGYENRLEKSGEESDPGGQLNACENYTGPLDQCVWEYLSELNYDDETTDPDITNCFQQAGDYKVSLFLKDFAGNVEGPDISQFQIKAGPPDPETSEFLLESECTDLSKTANGLDSCQANFKIKDQFGNPVTQLQGATISLFSDAIFDNDANKGDRIFRTGLQVKKSTDPNYIDIPTSTESPFTFTVNSNNEVSTPLDFIAWAPSIRKNGPYLGKNIPFNFALTLESPTVNEDGSLNSGELVSYELGQYTMGIGFAPWVKTAMEVLAQPSNFLLDTPIPMEIIRNVIAPFSGGPNGLASIFITVHNLNDYLYFNGIVFDPSSVDTTAQVTRIEPELKASREDAALSGTVAFSTDVAYEVDIDGNGADETTIRYPGGALGSGIEGADGGDGYNNQTLSTGAVGLSVEGKLIGQKDKGLVQDYNAVRLGDIASIEDIREEVFANAFKITRSIEPRAQNNNEVLTFSSAWFNNSDVVLVEGADVVIGSSSGTFSLPAGKNTLVIKNGNLIVSGDYGYANALDSMGFILVNDEIVEKPAHGNIFVKETVKRIVGTIYAEGAMMSISSLLMPTFDGDVSLADNSNRHADNNAIQLLFEGTLLTHNTLGGGVLVQNDVNYFTPWEETAGVSEAERLEAEDYDLNFMRYYQPKYSVGAQTNTADCVVDSATGNCDLNLNAMVIRYDSKATSLSPPGFENASFFGR